ncbi:type I DNA topoisomerase [Enhydrobacter sp.]|jgi:DNA topoisomerase-1|uniref:type I DNA topoisomerase n=1 Tax=Enhydrobacter sp. TaxID=1894999 RepID=UPI00262394BD|nr:type I DNA topoisomerase [Enhydrobacter sp.]WIM14165.1 MAG: DNA topoisomerase I [Enhydrobacter sp.]
MNVLVVESPAKAKTIGKYLGPGYTVLASYGHVRDLPAKDGSVRPDEDFAMDWEVDAPSQKRLDAIAKAVGKGGRLYLATDPDREGEAISWHVKDVLGRKKALQGVDVKRVTFNAITKQSVLDAVAHPRELDQPLIDAYLARRALDYLVGFTLSPVLWRKLPGSRSAGRVQSVALRLICEREAEIEVFRSREYWTVDAIFGTSKKQTLKARLTHLDGRKLDKFDLDSAERAEAAKREIERRAFAVSAIERRQVRRNPPPPFITSTLQQEASRKLGLGAATTMHIAQRLYEGVDIGGETVGLITYMRTDGVQLAPEAIGQTRRLIESRYGADYLPEKPRLYSSKAKNAQEAHEAIRPTDLFRTPQDVARYLDRDQLGLYELVWKRTVASQMESAVLDQVTVDIASGDKNVGLRATGSVVRFNGFLTLYDEGRDDKPEDENGNAILPDVVENEALERREVIPEQHFTEPPPRYSEASLVKKLEELGIGRPSTYASIIDVLQRRKYVRLERKRFVPEDRGRIVTAFLQTYFPRYVEYDFTAHLEEELDDISGGRIDWRQVLRDFWREFSSAVGETRDLRVSEVLDKLDEELGPHFFPANDNGGKSPRECPSCGTGRLGLKLGKFGAFIGCSNYPACRFTRKLGIVDSEADAASGANLDKPKLLGIDPETGKEVTLRNGPYGLYVQLGEPEGKEKPKRQSLLRGMTPDDVTLEKALALLALPRELGPHPDDSEPIVAGVGRFGPYVKHGKKYKSIPADESVLDIGMNRAVALLAEARQARGRAAAKPVRIVGSHPGDGQPIELYEGRYGPYVKHGGVNATVPRDIKPENLTVEQAAGLLAERAAKGGGKKVKAARPKKVAPAAANDTGQKPAPKKTAARKKAAPKRKAKAETPPRTGTDG